jgi:hypothetical protein
MRIASIADCKQPGGDGPKELRLTPDSELVDRLRASFGHGLPTQERVQGSCEFSPTTPAGTPLTAALSAATR